MVIRIVSKFEQLLDVGALVILGYLGPKTLDNAMKEYKKSDYNESI